MGSILTMMAVSSNIQFVLLLIIITLPGLGKLLSIPIILVTLYSIGVSARILKYMIKISWVFSMSIVIKIIADILIIIYTTRYM